MWIDVEATKCFYKTCRLLLLPTVKIARKVTNFLEIVSVMRLLLMTVRWTRQMRLVRCDLWERLIMSWIRLVWLESQYSRGSETDE